MARKKSAEVIKFEVPLHGKMTCKRFQAAVASKDYKEAIIIGYDKDGHFFQRNTGISRKDALWLLRTAEEDILYE